MTGTDHFEKGAESYMAKRERIVDSVGEISPSAAKIVDSWAPDVSTNVKPEPKYDLEAIKDDIVVYSKDAIQDTIGIDISTIKLDKIPSLGNLTKAATNSMSKVANAVKNKNNDPSNATEASNKEAANAEEASNKENANAENANNKEEATNAVEASNKEKANAEEASNKENANGENASNKENANAEEANDKEEPSNKPNKVKKLERGKGSRNVTRNAKKGGARKRTYKNQRRK
jgi:hypothetical protein